MKVRVCLVLVFAAVFLFRPVLGQNKEVLNLTLEECIMKALKNNLSLAAEFLNPELARHSVTKAKETFLPQFELTYGNDHQESPPYSWIQGETTITTKMNSYGVSIIQQIPTGGNFSLSLTGYKSDTNESYQLINPRLGNELRLDFTQPLLKNFGPKVSRREILLAENSLEISDQELQTTLLDTIYSVQESYWNLVYAIENLKVKQQSLQLARDLVAKNKKEVQFGQLASIEILNAEAVVAEREADLLQAEALIIRIEEELKVWINLAVEGDPHLKKVVPKDKPDFVAATVSQEGP
jgi:outer membrane protein